jgi:hypothetical protein
MTEYILGEPIYISDTERIYRYRVNNICTGDINPKSSVFVNSRLSSEFKDCEFVNLNLEYKPKSKDTKGFLDDFIKDNTTKAPGKVDIIIDNPDYDMVNNRFCVREVKTMVTLVKRCDKYYWEIKVNNYDIFDKLEEKVNNIMPIMSFSDIYEKDIGISLTTTKLKVKMILDFYWNLLEKNKRTELCEKVRNALIYL